MKKMMFVMVVLLATVFVADAQLATPRLPASDSTIKASVIRRGRYSSVLYTSNGLPLTRKGIEERLMLYPDAALELQKYKAGRHASLTFGCIAIASLVAGVIENAQHNTGASHVFLGIGISGLIAEMISGFSGTPHWGRSIEMYNSHFQ